MSPHRLDIDPDLLTRVNKALDEIRAGRMVILVDDEDRENEGDLTMAADKVTADAVNFMAVNGRNAVHNDAYQSDTYRNSGPLGQRLRVFSQSYDGMGGLGSCGITIAFDKHSRLVTTCISATSVQLRLMRPDLTTVATQALPPRVIPPGVNPFQSPGGAYFYVDNRTARSCRWGARSS